MKFKIKKCSWCNHCIISPFQRYINDSCSYYHYKCHTKKLIKDANNKM